MTVEGILVNNKKICKCGCGKFVNWYKANYVRGHNQRGKIPWNFKGSRKSSGYIFIYKPDHREADLCKSVREHRLVWEAAYNCCLLPWADIHHINEVKDDNRILNLQAMTKSQHATLSHTIDKSGRYCFLCNQNTTYTSKKGHQYWYKNIIEGQWVCSRCHNNQYNKTKRKYQ